MKTKKVKITKTEFYALGAWKNPNLFTNQTRAGVRTYWMVID